MANSKTIKQAFERNKKAIELRPSIAHSPVLDDFKRPIPVKREIKILQLKLIKRNKPIV